MSAPQFFVQELTPSSDRIVLSAEDSRHALRSLRLRPGEPVALADGRGAVARGRVGGARPDGMAVIDVAEVSRARPPEPFVSVALAPPKGDRLAWAVQKLAEIGVDELVLFESERSVRTLGARAERTLARLRAVAREAAMQSRRPFLMHIAGPVRLEEALALGPSRVIVLWEGGGERLAEALADDHRGVRLLVGPEGGFGEDEVSAAREAGASIAYLGEAVLRTETAAVAAAAITLSALGRLG